MLAYFSLTLFVSAFLLFLVQPMIGKMILPRLGGTPAVWNTCMVFFQAVLLVGYAYTHTLSTWRSRKAQLLTQTALLFLPLLVLPFALGAWEPPTESSPVFDVLLLLLGLVGLPFFVVSTSAPLLQKWFGHTGHPAAKDPYFLYGASNLGSMLALLAYPVLVEPWLGVAEQAVWWRGLYVVFMILVLGCVAIVWRTPEPAAADEPGAEAKTPAPIPAEAAPTAITAARRRTARREVGLPAASPRPDPSVELPADRDDITVGRRVRWVLLAAAPSSLMLGVTTYMTTDIAAIPFFWILPLALYLLTFILVFARWPVVWTTWPHEVVSYAHPMFILFLLLIMVAHINGIPIWGSFALHLTTFLLATLLCHGELAKDRPSAKHLTEFYLLMSLGGVLGGLFNALIAPVALRYGIWEYPIALALTGLLRPNLVVDGPIIPGDSDARRRTPLGTALDVATPVLVALMAWGMLTLQTKHDFRRTIPMAVAVIILLALSMRPIRFGLGVAALFFAATFFDRQYDQLVFEDRGFFGLVRVREYSGTRKGPHGEQEEYVYRTMIHGGIDHGRQFLKPDRLRATPTTYFHPTNGVGEVYGKFSWNPARLPASLVGLGGLDPWGQIVGLHSEPPFAVLGLGTGTLAAHARPLQTVHFYEIDPIVRDLSLPPEGREPVFYYLQDALDRGANLSVILGDGRLKIQEAPEKYYHIISLDAFSSDAIPVHLLTKEAVEEYMKRLADGGVLVFNTTNRYVRIEGPLAAIAKELNLDCLYCPDYADDNIQDKYAADWVVLQRKAPNREFHNGGPPIRQRLDMKRWENVEPLDPVWTDNYSNLLRVMRWRS